MRDPNRQPRTIIIDNDLWHSIEQAYLTERLSQPDGSVTKSAVLERLLTDGLDAMERRRIRRAPADEATSADAAAARHADGGGRARRRILAPVPLQIPLPAAAKTTRQRSSERLLQMSQAGARPDMIRSHADSPVVVSSPDPASQGAVSSEVDA